MVTAVHESITQGLTQKQSCEILGILPRKFRRWENPKPHKPRIAWNKIRDEERDAIEAEARKAGVPFAGLWLEAPRPALEARVEARRGDPSDATREVVALQAGLDPGPMSWTRLEATGTPEATEAAARAHLA